MKLKNTVKGFTLIEALIVVIIVGLLAGVGVVKLGQAKTDTLVSLNKSAAAEINKGLQRAIVANQGAGYTNAFLVADIASPSKVIDALVVAGHFTTASGNAMKDNITKATAAGASTIALALPVGGTVFAADGLLNAYAAGGYEATSTP